MSQLSPDWKLIFVALLILLATVLASGILLTVTVTRYYKQRDNMILWDAKFLEEMNKVRNNYSSLSESFKSLASLMEILLNTNDKVTTMLGTKGPLEFQAVQAMKYPDAYGNIDYVDPSDEAEVRRVNDLTRSGTNTAGADDEFPEHEHIDSQWSSWDDPGYVAKSIAEGIG